jgi:hypothetical protein
MAWVSNEESGGEHTPPACGLRRLAANSVSPFFSTKTICKDGGYEAIGGTPLAARETRALPEEKRGRVRAVQINRGLRLLSVPLAQMPSFIGEDYGMGVKWG